MEKSSPIICAISVIFTKLPEGNSRPIGRQNSPNPVTLVAGNVATKLELILFVNCLSLQTSRDTKPLAPARFSVGLEAVVAKLAIAGRSTVDLFFVIVDVIGEVITAEVFPEIELPKKTVRFLTEWNATNRTVQTNSNQN
jgi:hypothetical protein